MDSDWLSSVFIIHKMEENCPKMNSNHIVNLCHYHYIRGVDFTILEELEH